MNEDELAKLLHGEDRVGDADDEAARRTARTLRELLTREAVWAEPRPGGVDAVLAAMAGGAQPGRRPPGVGDDEPPGEPVWPGELYELRTRRSADAPPQHRRRRRGRRRTLALVSAAAAVVVVATTVGLLLGTDGGGNGDETASPEYMLSGTELAPDAIAVAQMDDPGAGLVIRLEIHGLDPAEPGTYYEGWLEGPDDRISVGTFHMREGDEVRLWSGVYPDEGYPTLIITREATGPATSPPGEVVLTGRLGP